MEPLRVGLIGLGTVGTGVARLLTALAERVERRAGRPIVLQRVAVRDPARPRGVELPPRLLTGDALAVARDADVDVIVELMGGLSPAGELIEAALEAGKDVVTANKALLCARGPELFLKARACRRSISFEAAVAGGIPIIAVLTQSMSGNQIDRLQAIINGTSNYILTEMFQRDQSYADCVRKAQELGYAEADPTMDVSGADAAQKLALLTWLAFGTRVTPDDFPVQGIDTIDLADLKYAHELGYAVKLLATARLVDGQLELHTQPTLVRHREPLAEVDGPFNMIALTGDAVGPTWYSGAGAGQMPTASAVVADLIDVAIGRAALTFTRLDVWGERRPFPVQPAEQIYRRYYLRFSVEDRPHVIADLADVLGRNQISLASIIQHEAPEVEETAAGGAPLVPLVIMSHRTTEGQVRAALTEIERLGCLRPPAVCMPVSD
jgi:homoserine dehydrogenase